MPPKGQSRSDPKINGPHTNDAETKVDAPPKGPPVSQVTEPLELESGPIERDELDGDVTPAEDAVMEVAIQLALQDGERRPRAVINGIPIWRGFERDARAGLTAMLYLEKRRG